MEKKELTKKFREAAHILTDDVLRYRNSTFSCIVLSRIKLNSYEIDKYEDFYCGDSEDSLAVMIQGPETSGVSKQTQRHRAIMLDLYAEMLEKGDL